MKIFTIDVHHYIHHHDSQGDADLRRIERLLVTLGDRFMSTTQELLELARAVGPAVNAFEARITDLVKNGSMSQADKDNIDAAVAELRASLADAADGVDEADVPAAPPADPNAP